MPWSNQSGGGGPWGQRGGPGGPWGSGPQGGGGGGGFGGGSPPDLEEILRRGQDRLKTIIPGGSMGGKGLAAILLGAVLLWLATGFYTVRPNEVGINLVFGRYVGQSGPGLNYNLPYPIGSVIRPNVTAVNRTEVGYRPGGPQGRARDVVEESLMLTGDGNIVDIDFDALWRVDPSRANNYVFNLQNPEGTVKAVAESAMREVIGRRQIQAILTTEQASLSNEVQDIMQHTLNGYGAGVLVTGVQLQAAVPPPQVRESFYDVNAAQQDAVRVQNEAGAYASRVVPEARGQVTRIVQQAEGYREQVVAEATGQASRFNQIYDAYSKAPDVIRQRIFLETMERVLGGADKVLIDQNAQGGQGVVPYLPLNELQRRPSPPAGASQGAGQAQGSAR
jgi:membrane protease subunit HflK